MAPVAPQTTLERAMELIDQVIPEAVAAPLPPTALEEAAPTAAAPPAKAAMPTTIAEAQ